MFCAAADAIVPPAAATHAVIGRSNVVPVNLGKWLLFDILRQLALDPVQLALDRPD